MRFADPPYKTPSPGRLDPAAEHLGDAPGLGDAAAGGVGRLGVEDLADAADARLVEVTRKAGEILQILLKNGADSSFKGEDGRTILMRAIETGFDLGVIQYYYPNEKRFIDGLGVIWTPANDSSSVEEKRLFRSVSSSPLRPSVP